MPTLIRQKENSTIEEKGVGPPLPGGTSLDGKTREQDCIKEKGSSHADEDSY